MWSGSFAEIDLTETLVKLAEPITAPAADTLVSRVCEVVVLESKTSFAT